jgi:hypothetical protein
LLPLQLVPARDIARCPHCQVAVWSHYPNAGELAAFVRVGTLDDKTALAPDVHIFTASKVPWLELTDSKPALERIVGNAERVIKNPLFRAGFSGFHTFSGDQRGAIRIAPSRRTSSPLK